MFVTARTHDLAAITALSIIYLSRPEQPIRLSTMILCILFNLLGGITPDIDQPIAPLWRNLPVGRFAGKFVGRLMGGHRFLTHSILGIAFFGFLMHWLLVFLGPIMGQVDTGLVWWAFMIGLVSHLVMDTFTKEGVPWLLPLPFKFGFPPIRKLRITTGKAAENFVVIPLLVVVNLLFLSAHYQEILKIMHRFVV